MRCTLFYYAVISGSSTQCYASNECSGAPLSTTETARECCVESDYSQSYMTSDGCRRCIGVLALSV